MVTEKQRSGTASAAQISHVVCAVCKKRLIDSYGHPELRKHVDHFHFPSYKPYRQVCCGFRFGDPKLVGLAKFCCSRYTETSADLPQILAGEKQNKIAELGIEVLVRHSVITCYGRENEDKLLKHIKKLANKYTELSVDSMQTEIKTESEIGEKVNGESDSVQRDVDTAAEQMSLSLNVESVSGGVNFDVGKKAPNAEDDGQEKSDDMVVCEFCSESAMFHVNEIEDHCISKHELPGTLQCRVNTKKGLCNFTCGTKEEMQDHYSSEHKKKSYKTNVLYSAEEKEHNLEIMKFLKRLNINTAQMED